MSVMLLLTIVLWCIQMVYDPDAWIHRGVRQKQKKFPVMIWTTHGKLLR